MSENNKNRRAEVSLNDNFHLFRQPSNIDEQKDLFSLSEVLQDSESHKLQLKYRLNQSKMENLRPLENAEVTYEGREIPLRNHLIAVQKQPDGHFKVMPVSSLVQFSRVFENDKKKKVVVREEEGKQSSVGNSSKMISFRVKESE